MDEHERILRYGIPGWVFIFLFVGGSFIQNVLAKQSPLFVADILEIFRGVLTAPSVAVFLIAGVGVAGIPLGFIIGQLY